MACSLGSLEGEEPEPEPPKSFVNNPFAVTSYNIQHTVCRMSSRFQSIKAVSNSLHLLLYQ